MRRYAYISYEDYLEAQREANERKRETHQAAIRARIEELSEYLSLHCNPAPAVGLCHGSRSGLEQLWFHEFLDADVWGTDIGDMIAPRTIKHDFNKPLLGWLDRADFIYSNSFDHAWDPEATFLIWQNQLRVGGLMLIEHAAADEKISRSEANGMTMRDWIAMIGETAGVVLEDVLHFSATERQVYLAVLVIRKGEIWSS